MTIAALTAKLAMAAAAAVTFCFAAALAAKPENSACRDLAAVDRTEASLFMAIY